MSLEQNLSFAVPFSTQNPIFCGLTIHLHRNLSGYLFPSKLTPDDKAKVSSFILSALKPLYEKALVFQAPIPLDVKETFPSMTQELQNLLIDPDKKLTFSVIDHDHLVMTLHSHETDFKKLYDEIRSLTQKIDPLFHYAFHDKLGYLTSHPEVSGLGIRLEAYLFCPLMESAPKLDDRFVLEPFLNHKALYVLKCKKTHSLELSEVIQKFLSAVNLVMKQEQDAREGFFKANKDQIIDQVSKSLALLKGAHQMNFNETLQHLLNVKLGYHLNLLKGLDQDMTLKLLWQATRSHLSETLNQKETKDDWLHERADWLKNSLSAVEIKL